MANDDLAQRVEDLDQQISNMASNFYREVERRDAEIRALVAPLRDRRWLTDPKVIGNMQCRLYALEEGQTDHVKALALRVSEIEAGVDDVAARIGGRREGWWIVTLAKRVRYSWQILTGKDPWL